MENRIADDSAYITCDPQKIDCRDCVYAFVNGMNPMKNFCGKYARKPSYVYFKNQKCHFKKPFQNVKQEVDNNINNDNIVKEEK